jgi:hypothetical protein
MKGIFFHVLAAALLMGFCAPSDAEEFALKTYKFIGELPEEGRIRLRVEKDPGGLSILVSSLGGALATVAIHPSRAEAVGRVLLQAKAVYDRHQQYYLEKKNISTPLYREEYVETVKQDEYQIVFQSAPRGDEFTVKFGPVKPFSPMVLMNHEEAVGVGKRLLQGEDLAEFVNRHVTF